ncbi:MAG: VanW family protein [Candidatus Dojkabacteria bacterium]|nr:VanW family protein [Candidatus Dojkabacteria bacterium]
MVSINIDDLLTENFDENVLNSCQKYNEELKLITSKLEKSFSKTFVESLLPLLKTDENYNWVVTDINKLNSLLAVERLIFDKPAFEGDYEVNGENLYLYQNYKYGKTMDLESTLNNLIGFLINVQTKEITITYKLIPPKVLSSNYNIMDFTNLVGKGKTRFELERYKDSEWIIDTAVNGLKEVDKTIIMPGEEFSYLKAIGKVPGESLTKNGAFIGNGFCNSTTTIFRAALESDLPVTARSSHGTYISSYGWGYPLNIVDSTFFCKRRL